MRELFGSWGARLDDDSFAAAVAARLVELGYVKSETERFGSLDAALDALAAGTGTFRFGDWASVRGRWPSSAFAPEALAAAWKRIQNTRPVIVTPDLEPARGLDASFAIAVLDNIARRSTDAKSVVAKLTPSGESIHEWRWPLRVGVLPEANAREIAEALSAHEFVKVSPALEGARDWDILYLPVSLAAAIAAPELGRLRARVVFVAGNEFGLDPGAVPASLALLRTLVSAHAAVLGGAALAEAGSMLRMILDGVAHDVRFDEAIFEVLRDGERPPLFVSDLRFLDSTRASIRLDRIGDKLTSVGPDVIDVPQPHALPGLRHVANGGGPTNAETVGTVIKERGARAEWGRETGAATGTAILSQLVDEALAPRAEKAEARFLQTAAKREGAAAGDPFASSLRSDETYELSVWIGPREKEAFGLSVVFPTLENPHETHELSVVLNEPNLLSEPQMGKLELPPVGKTEPCRFVLHCRPKVKRIEARIAILHRGRVLQTGVLRGPILKAGEKETAKSKLSFTLDAAPRRRLQTLGGRSRFDAALITNHRDDGTTTTLGVVGKRVARIKLESDTLDALVTCFNTAISEIADKPADFKKLRSKGTLALLRELAQHGSRLHEVIEKHSLVGPALAKADRLQIVTARVDGFLPLELAYRYEAPDDDAELCKGAETALKKGECPASCGRTRGTDTRLCPLGFWGLSKTVERFAHVPEHVAEDSDFSLYAEPITKRERIPRPKTGVVAGSLLAIEEDKQALKRVEAAVKSHATLVSAKNWDEWVTQVSKKHPELLVLLPHHTSEGSNSILEIGKDSRLKATLVKEKHVFGDPKPSPLTRPIVLLLGCETEDSEIAFERFPSMFAERGAAIVVGTIATVLGRHASPAAVHLIDELYRSSRKPRSFGELLVDARRRLLANGSAMCLALVGFGDADWQIA